jgi:hypothetical protein
MTSRVKKSFFVKSDIQRGHTFSDFGWNMTLPPRSGGTHGREREGRL